VQSKNNNNMQENTFGQILPIQATSSQVMSPSESLQLRGTFEKVRDMHTEDMLKKIADLEESEARLKLEKQQLLDRISHIEQDSDLRIDELMHENDNLIKQLDQLAAKCKSQQENLLTLSQTLNETQNELESLVTEHEKLGEQAREMQELAESYKSQMEQAHSDLGKARNEIVEVKREVARQREELGQKRAEITSLKESIYR